MSRYIKIIDSLGERRREVIETPADAVEIAAEAAFVLQDGTEEEKAVSLIGWLAVAVVLGSCALVGALLISGVLR